MPGLLTEITVQEGLAKERMLRKLVAALTYLQREDIKDPKQVIVRDLLPQEDLNSGDDNGWTTAHEWEQDFSSGTADADNQAYQIDSDNAAQGKVIGFVRIANQTTGTTQAREASFRNGTNGDQGIRDKVQLEPMNSKEEVAAYLADPVIYTLNEDGDVAVWMDAVNTEQLVFDGVVGEKVGDTISVQPVNPVISSDQEAHNLADKYLSAGAA